MAEIEKMVVGGFKERWIPDWTLPGEIFLSHSKFQREFTTLLCQALRDAHYFSVMDELDDDIGKHPWTQRKEWNHFMRNVAQQERVVILVLSNEFFMSKRPMMELNEFAKAQALNKLGMGSDPKLNILPVLLDMSFTEFDKSVIEKKWHKSWEDMKEKYDRSIDLKEWQQALSIIYDNEVVRCEYGGHGEFIKSVVDAICMIRIPVRFNAHYKSIQPFLLSNMTSYTNVTEQKFAKKPKGTTSGAVSNTILLQHTNIEATFHTFDKLAIRNLDMGEESGLEN